MVQLRDSSIFRKSNLGEGLSREAALVDNFNQQVKLRLQYIRSRALDLLELTQREFAKREPDFESITRELKAYSLTAGLNLTYINHDIEQGSVTKDSNLLEQLLGDLPAQFRESAQMQEDFYNSNLDRGNITTILYPNFESIADDLEKYFPESKISKSRKRSSQFHLTSSTMRHIHAPPSPQARKISMAAT